MFLKKKENIWIIKTILNKLYIHPFSLLLIVLVALTGMYKEFIIVFLIIIIHELGHFILAKAFKWNIDKISIYPFGGCVKFNEKINKPIYQEFIILLAGPFFQIVLFIIINILFNNNIINYRNYILFRSYHNTILLFNLLPIYPLDGGKLLNLICNYLFPYKKGNKLVIYISYLLVLILIVRLKNLNLFLIGVFLISEITIYFKRQDYLYNKFLLERYLNSFKFNKLKIVKNKNDMYKEKRHVLKVKSKYYTEKEYLNKRFKEKV